jgi:hypothetical protein
MRPLINLRLNPNNQLVLTRGDWVRKEEAVYKTRQMVDSDVTNRPNYQKNLQARSEAQAAQIAAYEEKKDLYKWRIEQAKKSSVAPLDLILESQRDSGGIPRTSAPNICQLNRPKSFTKISGQRLRECGAAVDIASQGQSRFCHEVTLTLPANTEEAFIALAAKSPYIINRLFQPIRRDYGDMCHWFFVWEYQKRGALHLHICICHPDESEGQWICARLVEQWHKILCDLEDECDCSFFLSKRKDRCTIRAFHQHHCAPIQKNVGAYFSKYAGKEESKNSIHCQKYPISRFWGSSRSLKRIVRENKILIEMDLQTDENAERMMQEIIENIIEKLNIVSTKSYKFAIELKGKHRLNQYQNCKILVTDPSRLIAHGERFTFYFECGQLELAKSLIHEFMNT